MELLIRPEGGTAMTGPTIALKHNLSNTGMDSDVDFLHQKEPFHCPAGYNVKNRPFLPIAFNVYFV